MCFPDVYKRQDSCLNFMINAPFQLCITRVGKLRLSDDQKLVLPLPLVLRKRQHLSLIHISYSLIEGGILLIGR